MKPRTSAQSALADRRARYFVLGGLALALTTLLATPARADIIFYNVFYNASYVQTSDGTPTAAPGYWGNLQLISTNTADLTSVAVTVPGSSLSSPITLPNVGGGDFLYYTPTYSTAADLAAALPTSTTYTYTVTGGTFDGQSAILTTPSSDAYASTIPYLTNNGYTSLQGANADSTINLTWNSYTQPAGATASNTDFTISQASTGAVVFSAGGSNTFTSTSIPAGTLLPGTEYDLEINYDSRTTLGSGFTDATGFVAYDVRTDLSFTTAVPEPTSLILLACGVGIVAVASQRRLDGAIAARRFGGGLK